MSENVYNRKGHSRDLTPGDGSYETKLGRGNPLTGRDPRDARRSRDREAVEDERHWWEFEIVTRLTPSAHRFPCGRLHCPEKVGEPMDGIPRSPMQGRVPTLARAPNPLDGIRRLSSLDRT